MRLILLGLLFLVLAVRASNPHGADLEDNEFAEFEDLDEDEGAFEETKQEEVKEKKIEEKVDDAVTDEEDDETTVETEDDEFEHFTDEEEFVGFDPERETTKPKEKFDLKMATVPPHLRTNWDSFVIEILMLAGLGVYLLNFLHGKNNNHKLAQAWLNSHRTILEEQFSIVGDDGTSKEAQSGTFIKESENVYALWCSGRSCVEGMLVELKLIKRQDLISTIAGFMKPVSDQIMIQIDMDPKIMDKFVFAVAQKRSCAKLHKDLVDLSQFTEKKNGEKYDLVSSYQILSEIGEATVAILDKKVIQVLNKYEGQVEYMHFSDQYSGPKAQDENQSGKLPEVKPVLTFCFNVPGKGKCKPTDMEKMLPLLKLVLYCVDKVSRLQLGKEARAKADKKRQKMQEVFEKATHQQRQEQAQQRREEKRRQEKERLMNEEDPDKARKMEERDSRREAKRKQPKMKMMKVKAM